MADLGIKAFTALQLEPELLRLHEAARLLNAARFADDAIAEMVAVDVLLERILDVDEHVMGERGVRARLNAGKKAVSQARSPLAALQGPVTAVMQAMTLLESIEAVHFGVVATVDEHALDVLRAAVENLRNRADAIDDLVHGKLSERAVRDRLESKEMKNDEALQLVDEETD